MQSNLMPRSMCGTLAERPAAANVPVGTFYFETDNMTLYDCALVGGVHVWEGSGGSGTTVGAYVLDPDGDVPGSFPTFGLLYAAYSQGVGPAVIFIEDNCPIPAGSYTFRAFTSWQGSPSLPTLSLADGVVFHLQGLNAQGVIFESHSSTPVFDLGLDEESASILLGFEGILVAAGTSPMVVWSVPIASGVQLFVTMRDQSQLRNAGSPVIHIQGGGADNPTVQFDLGAGVVVQTNTVTSNADATAVPFVEDVNIQLVGAQPGYLGVGGAGIWLNLAAIAGANLDMNNHSLQDDTTGQVSFKGGARCGQRPIAAAGVAAGLVTDYIVSFEDTSAPSSYQAIAMGCPAGQRIPLIIQDTSFASAYGVALVNPITIHCLAGKKLNNVVNGTAQITTGGGSASFLIDENDNMIQLGGA